MFCSNCGKELQEGIKFCPYCGKSVNSNVVAQTNDANKITKEFEANLLNLYKLVKEVEYKQRGLDLCQMVSGFSPGGAIKSIFNKGLISGFVGGSVNSGKAISELKKNYNIGSLANVASLATIGGVVSTGEYKQHAEQFQKELESLINNNTELLKMIPTRYLSSMCVEYLLTIVQEGRAKTINEALDKLDQQIHYWNVENGIYDINDTLEYWGYYGIYI